MNANIKFARGASHLSPRIDVAKYERLRFTRELKRSESLGVLDLLHAKREEHAQGLLHLASGMNSYGRHLWDGRDESSLAALTEADQTQGRIDLGLVRECLAHRAQITRLQAQSDRLRAELDPLDRLVTACEIYIEGVH